MRHFKTFLTVIGAVTVLVLAANTVAYAATGGKFVLGKTNTAGKVSTLKRTKPGTALKLITKSSANAPLSTNGSGKVTNLNADLIDGLDSSALQTIGRQYTLPAQSGVSQFSVAFPGLAPGIYQASYSVTGSMSAAVPLNCHFQFSDGDSSVLVYGGVSSVNNVSAVSGAGIIDVRARTAKLRCFALGATFTLAAPAAQVSFVTVDSLGSGAGTNARVAPEPQVRATR